MKAAYLLAILAIVASLAAGCDKQTGGADPQKAEALHEQGQQQAMRGDFKSAIASYDKAIKLNRNDAFIYFNRGAAKLNTGDFDGAIADFTEVIKVEPKIRGQAYKARGQAKQMKGDMQGAQEDFRKQYE